MNTNPFFSKVEAVASWIVPLAAVAAVAAWFIIAPEGALGKLDAIGYAVCHRIDARSFHIGDRQLPLCSRCTGEFYAAGIALLFQAVFSKRRNQFPPRAILAALFVFFVAFGIDGANSYLYMIKTAGGGAGFLASLPLLYEPSRAMRLFTGSGMGIALAAILYPVVNQTLWREQDDRPALEWKHLGILVAVVFVVNLLILTDSPVVLYPIAYISALGTLSLLTVVFGLLWTIIMRQENTFDRPRQLWLVFAAGLTLALILVLGIDLFRLRLTGTWGGFPGLE